MRDLLGMETWSGYGAQRPTKLRVHKLTKPYITHFATGVCGEDSMQLARG